MSLRSTPLRQEKPRHRDTEERREPKNLTTKDTKEHKEIAKIAKERSNLKIETTEDAENTRR